LRAHFTYEPATAELRYKVELAGLRAEEVRLVALHGGQQGGKAGGILGRVVEPGRIAGGGSLGLGFRAREDLYAGRLYMQAYTREQPTGTLRLQIAFPGLGSR
jgi:hypothetical protein